MSSRARIFFLILPGVVAVVLGSCSDARKVEAKNPGGTVAASSEVTVGVVKIGRKPMGRTLTLSSELVPFQEIDVYAKESGYVKELNVDYGSRVQANQVLATLEIPELQSQLKQDDAAIKSATDQITYAHNLVSRADAQHNVLQLQFGRLDSVAKSKPGLVAQQEVDDSEGRALASAAQVEAAKSNLQTAESQLAAAEAKREHDQVLADYSKITAPFAGTVTQRFANLGTLVQAGTNSSTQAMPIVRLSQDDLFRLVIPVPETYVRFIHIGDPVSVAVPSLNRTFPGKVARFSVDVREDTRTMHTEVDVPNMNRVLLPGLYAQATINLEQRADALALPLQALNQENGETSVYIVNSSNAIEKRRVEIGIQTDTDAELVSGLREGEMVVVSDRSSLKPGQLVRPQMVDLVQYHGPEDENKDEQKHKQDTQK
jgi:RND family efflux transporter MFP subunit